MLRASGSLNIFAAFSSGSCPAIVARSSSFVSTQNSPAAASGSSRVNRLLDHRALAVQRQHLLGRARRLRGQKRVPLPPARITGANTIGLEDFSIGKIECCK